MRHMSLFKIGDSFMKKKTKKKTTTATVDRIPTHAMHDGIVLSSFYFLKIYST